MFDAINNVKYKYSFRPDGIPAMYLTYWIYSSTKPLHFFSISLTGAVFPDISKVSYPISIYKSENREDITNYRGV